MYCNVQRQIDRRQLEVIFGLNTRQQVNFRERHRRLLLSGFICLGTIRGERGPHSNSHLTHSHHMSEPEEWGRVAPTRLNTQLTELWTSD